MSFASPLYLLALLLIPIAVAGYLLLDRRRARRSADWSRRAMLPNIVQGPTRRLRYVPAVLFLIGLTLLLVGFARPQRFVENASKGGPTIVLTLDTSGSMAADDIRPTRLLAARQMLVRLLRQLPSRDRIALVTFADKVRVPVRPTFDRTRVVAMLPKEVTPLGGTSIGEAITQALAVTVGAVGKGVPGDPYPPGAMVLVSDGDQTDVGTRPQDAAQLASSVGIPVDTVALGTPGGEVVQPVKAEGGGQNQTQTIQVPVDGYTLQQVAQTSGGRAFTGTGTARLVKTLEAVGSHTSRGRSPRELNVAAAAAALVFIVAGVALSGVWFGRIA